MKRLRDLPLGVRLALACVAAETLLIFFLIYAGVRTLDDRLIGQAQLRIESLARLFNATLADPLMRKDYGQLIDILRSSQGREDIVYVVLTDLDGRVLVSEGNQPHRHPPSHPVFDLRAAADSRAPWFDARTNIAVRDQVYGQLHFGVSTRFLAEARLELISKSILASVIAIAVSAAVFVFLGFLLTKNLASLTDSAEALASGEMDVSLDVRGHDEVGRLTMAFNRMAVALGDRLALLRENEDRLNRSVDELLRSNDELERFAFVASHDLQEPVRTVVAYSQLLERSLGPRLDEESGEYLRFLVTGARRMHDLVRDLLAYSRIKVRDKPFQPVSMAGVVQSVLQNLDAAIRESGASIDVGPLPTVHGDPFQLLELMQNLLVNAIKFRSPDRLPHVTISAGADGAEWVVAVRDNGIGLDLRFKEQIFLAFKRLHTADTYPGTGIGLAICKRVAERHGGRIWVEAEVGVGSTFCVALPATPSASPVPDTVATTEGSAPIVRALVPAIDGD